MKIYSNPEREHDPYSLPDVEVFELTAREVAEMDEDLVWEYLKERPLASVNSKERERLLDRIVEEEGITGGWYYWHCLPGCLPDSAPEGPFATEQEAIDACRAECED